MWSIDKNTSAVTMHKGDTGAYWVNLTKTNRQPFVSGDVAIYEVKQGNTVKIHREFDLQPAEPTDVNPGNGRFLISFRNSDTDTWASGSYLTELKVVLAPIRNDGRVADGNTVRTITAAKSTITIIDVMINV